MRYIGYRIRASDRREDAPELRNGETFLVGGFCRQDEDPLAVALRQVPYLRYYNTYAVSIKRGFNAPCTVFPERRLADIQEQARRDREDYRLNERIGRYYHDRI